MPTKLLIVLLCTLLTGCFNNSSNKVVVVDKSDNKENAVSSYELEQAKNTGKSASSSSNQIDSDLGDPESWSLPIDAEILKGYSPNDNHPGVTYASQPNQKIRAIRDGKVVYSGGKMKSLGKMVIVRHAFGYYSSYTQNQLLYVQEGDKIKKGQVISLTGNQPFYFEMKKYSDTINPLKYLNE